MLILMATVDADSVSVCFPLQIILESLDDTLTPLVLQ